MAEDFANLTPEQTEKVLQFQELTSIDSVAVCRDVLHRHSWDLEVAVQEQLNIHEGRPSVFSSDSNVPEVLDETSGSIFFPRPPNRTPGIQGFFTYVVSLVFHICYNAFSSFLQLALRLIRPDPRRFVTDPVGDVMNFITTYETKYGFQHPTFYQGTYNQALNDAKRELRFLLVYLHCEDHQDTTFFCSNILPCPSVVEFINSNMLFWACSVTTSEGYRVSQALRENGYPFLAVIVLKDGRMTVVGRLEGPVNSEELISRLAAVIAVNEGHLHAARAERVERSFNQTLRQQQDEAYMESLRADQEKERRRCEERERKEGEERIERERQLQEQLRKEEIKRQKLESSKNVPEEPESNHPEAVHVVLKLPNGKRLERRFLQSHLIEAVFCYVFCHPDSPDSFEIATNFPKRVLAGTTCCNEQHKQTLAQAGLRRGEVLFVYDLEA